MSGRAVGWLLLLSLLPGVGWADGPPAPRPNLLLIVADDLGLQLGSYGDPVATTPSLDALAASGVRFEVAWVAQASCSPSRSALLTGLHPHANGHYGLTSSGTALHPHLREATLPGLLKRAGYRTGLIGKLHVAPEESFPFDFRGVGRRRTRDVRRVADEARGFMAETSGAPFFLMVSYWDPHAFPGTKQTPGWHYRAQVEGLPVHPLEPGPQTLLPFQRVDSPEQRERTAGYYNAVLRLDAGIGLLMAALDETGHRDDTLVVFVSDHGPPFARGKLSVYEGGLRVPFLVRWPGVSSPGVSGALVSSLDVLPTLLEAAGQPVPEGLHGRSLEPILRGSHTPWRSHLLAGFHFHGDTAGFQPRRAVRDRRYKLIRSLLPGAPRKNTRPDGDAGLRAARQPRYAGTPLRRAWDVFAEPPPVELYDLESDPAELVNLAGRPEHAAVRARLETALARLRRETGDPLLDPDALRRMLERFAAP